MSDPLCPSCSTALVAAIDDGVIYVCPARHGTAMTMDLLDRRAPDAVVGRLLVAARERTPGTKLCPFCAPGIKKPRVHMVELEPLPGFVAVDICPLCRGVWLEDGEYTKLLQALDEVPPPS